MRILLSAYGCDPEAGSEPGSGWNWARTLSESGHEVWVLTGDPFRDRGRLFQRAATVENLHIIEVPVPRPARVLLRWAPGTRVYYFLWLRQTYRVAKRLLKSRPFDLAHHVSLGSLVWGSPLVRLGIPFVFGPVGGGQVVPPALDVYVGRHLRGERLRSGIVRMMRVNPLARATVRHAIVVLATNRATEDLVRSLGATSVRLVADSAVPPELFDSDRSVSESGELIEILWLGGLHPIKGLRLALDALSRVAPDINWRCTIVGDGPIASEVPIWLERFRIADRTTWVGAVSWKDISQVYERADIFLFTSLRDSLGAQLYEASAFGLPIIALDHHGVADLLPDDVAFKVPVGDPEQTAQGLARAIEALARAPAERKAMGLAALRFAERNTWGARVQETYSIIESHLGRRPAG